MKTVLSILCKGNPYNWPKYLGDTQRALNTAVHTTLGEQPHFAFFSRRAPRQVTSVLPLVEDDAEDSSLARAHQVIQETALEMTRKYRNVANKNRKSQTVTEGSLVWVKKETIVSGTSRKLNPKWTGPYKVQKVIREGAKYELVNIFDQTVIERAADKIKPYYSSEQWLSEPQEIAIPENEHSESVEQRSARNKAPRKRLIEEM